MTQYGFVATDPSVNLAAKFSTGGQRVMGEEDGTVWISLHPEAGDIPQEAWIDSLEQHYQCVFDGTREV